MEAKHFLYLSQLFTFVEAEKINHRRIPGTCHQQLFFALPFFFSLSLLLRRES